MSVLTSLVMITIDMIIIIYSKKYYHSTIFSIIKPIQLTIIKVFAIIQLIIIVTAVVSYLTNLFLSVTTTIPKSLILLSSIFNSLH